MVQSSSTFYWAVIDWFNSQAFLYKVVGGSPSTLASLFLSSLSADAWYRASFTLAGTSLSLTAQRVSDGYWLDSTGNFQSGSATALSAFSSVWPITSSFGSSYSAPSLPERRTKSPSR